MRSETPSTGSGVRASASVRLAGADVTTLLLYEHLRDDDTLARTSLRLADGALVLVVGDEELPLPDGAVAAVMRRYGKPLDDGETPDLDAVLALGNGASLARFRFMARFDVIRRDWLVYQEGSGGERLCEMATSVTAALEHLARRASV
ncbi:MAG: hypothetical protein JWP97_2383 [Labilithrix sp.]|nr:hypothetical protein [Labilithrix sp.]